MGGKKERRVGKQAARRRRSRPVVAVVDVWVGDDVHVGKVGCLSEPCVGTVVKTHGKAYTLMTRGTDDGGVQRWDCVDGRLVIE